MFRFKQFVIHQEGCAMKVGTDGVLLGAWAQGGKRILDIGTGTGILALMMAQRFPDASITAIDIDNDAFRQAEENIANSPFADRINVVHSSLQNFPNEMFDCIVSNPPFFEDSLLCPDEQRSLARHTASLSFRELILCSSQLLTDNGVMSMIVPTDRIHHIEAIIEALSECKYNTNSLSTPSASPLHISHRLDIKTVERKQPKRTLLLLTKQSPTTPIHETQLLMISGERSPWFQALTEDFYLE